MKNRLILAMMLAGAIVAQAEEMALWKDKMPGYRKALDVSLLPEKIFGLGGPVATQIDTSAMENAKLKAEVDKVSTLKVTGLMWSNDRKERRVLMGDLVMREGQAIPAYVFNDDRNYILVEISRDRLRFRSEAMDQSNPFAFEVPFGLKDPVRNQSDFSTTKNAQEK